MLKSKGDYTRYTCFSWDEFLKKNHKKYSFSRVEANKIMKRFALLCHEEIFQNPEGLKLFRIGTIIISGNPCDKKDPQKSNKDKRMDYRNVKTNQVVYTSKYIYGKGRGKCLLSLLWNFKNTVPFRQRIKKMIDEGKHHHWFVTEKMNDIIMIGIPPERRKH